MWLLTEAHKGKLIISNLQWDFILYSSVGNLGSAVTTNKILIAFINVVKSFGFFFKSTLSEHGRNSIIFPSHPYFFRSYQQELTWKTDRLFLSVLCFTWSLRLNQKNMAQSYTAADIILIFLILLSLSFLLSKWYQLICVQKAPWRWKTPYKS